MVEDIKDKNYNLESFIKEMEKRELYQTTLNIQRILEFEINHGRLPSKREYIRELGFKWDEVDKYINIINSKCSYKSNEIEYLKKFAEKVLKDIKKPNLYDFIKTLDTDYKTAMKIGQLLIDDGYIESFPRILGKKNNKIKSFKTKERNLVHSTIIPELKQKNLKNLHDKNSSITFYQLVQIAKKIFESIDKKLEKIDRKMTKYHASFWENLKMDVDKYKEDKISFSKLCSRILKKVLKKVPKIFKYIAFLLLKV